MQPDKKKKPMVWIETGFDVAYLSTVLLSGILLCVTASSGSDRLKFGIMALILGCGDAFHLIPRIYALWNGGTKAHTALLGIGKLITSVTMTVFYVILWNIGIHHYTGIAAAYITTIIYALAALRIALCLFPQNKWMSENSPLKWAVWRNVPFLILGAFVTVLFARGSYAMGDGFSLIWIAVIISFACYIPVVLFSGQNRKVGMLMLPKSCAYAAIVLMGFSLARM